MPNGIEANRAVFVPVRSYANAVARNRARRLVRECWRIGKSRSCRGTMSRWFCIPDLTCSTKEEPNSGACFARPGFSLEKP